MARQAINNQSGSPNNPAAEAIQTAFDKVNAMTSDIFRVTDTSAVQWVAPAPMGNNANDGKTPFAPKLTVAAAVKALPIFDTGTVDQRHVGMVCVEPGFYDETDTPIPFHAGLQIVGMGNTFNSCIVRLASGRNTALFSWRETQGLTNESGNPPAATTPYLHGAMLANMYLDGNKANNSTAPPLVRLINGGFGCVLRDLYIRNAKSYGLYIQKNALTIKMFNVNFAICDGGALDFRHDGATNTHLIWIGGEVDNSGIGATGAPIKIRENGTPSYEFNCITFMDVKFEGDVGTDSAESFIRFVPHTAGTGSPIGITLISCGANHNDTTSVKKGLAYEENGTATGAKWTFINCRVGTQYPRIFISDKTGVEITGQAVNFATTDGRIQLAKSQILSGTGSPEGVVTALIGSLFLRTDGSTSTTLYVKTSGTGNTGWTAK